MHRKKNSWLNSKLKKKTVSYIVKYVKRKSLMSLQEEKNNNKDFPVVLSSTILLEAFAKWKKNSVENYTGSFYIHDELLKGILNTKILFVP